jgi:thioesterase domain-containing protein
MANQLQSCGERVALLTLMGISAWDFPTLVAPGAWRRWRLYRLADRYSLPWFLSRARVHLDAARSMSAGSAVRYLARRAGHLFFPVRKGMPRVVTHPPRFMSRFKEAFARYVPTPFTGRPVLFLAREETAGYSRDPSADWARLGTEGVDVREVPGDHDELLVDPQVGAVATQLCELLDSASRDRLSTRAELRDILKTVENACRRS